MQKLRVLISILNYKNHKDSVSCIKSIFKQKYKDFKIVVIDNNSPNNSYSGLKKNLKLESIEFSEDLNFKKQVSIFKSTHNLGFAGGHNIVLRNFLNNQDFDLCWILNPDTILDENALSKMIKSYSSIKKQDLKPGIIGSKLLYLNRKHKIQAMGGQIITSKLFGLNVENIGSNQNDEGQFDKDIKPDYIVGASMLVDKGFLENVGCIPEEYFLFFEESEWALKSKKLGFVNKLEPESIVYHAEGGSYGGFSPASFYYYLRNKFFFTQKWYSSLIFQTLVYNLKFVLKFASKPKLLIAIFRAYRDYFLKKKGKNLIYSN